jgi:PAS domain-containing protein
MPAWGSFMPWPTAWGGYKDLNHGECNSLLLERVVRFNFPAAADKYLQLARAMGVRTGNLESGEAAAALVDRIAYLRIRLGITQRLRDMGVASTELPQLSALHENERRLRLLTDNLPARISYVDADRRFQFVNREYERFLGLSRNAIIGRHLRDVLGEDHYGKIEKQVHRLKSWNRWEPWPVGSPMISTTSSWASRGMPPWP